ncbi:MAG: cell division protein ZapA [Candidatus Eisenbacteria sp.]|nr:cell division protein ZapA [Candidatus Eisenbacteria bacterium]
MGEVSYTKVTILGEEYRVSGRPYGATISELAAYVDDTIGDIKQHSSVVDMKRLAVLTALNLADELLRERARSQTVLDQVRERADKLDSILGEALGNETQGMP